MRGLHTTAHTCMQAHMKWKQFTSYKIPLSRVISAWEQRLLPFLCARLCACSVSRLRRCPCLCTGSQLVRQLSRSDLWPLDSNLSSLPVQYCYNWQLMRPDMLSSRALNRTSIFPRHKYHFCTLSLPLAHTAPSFLFAFLVLCLSVVEYLTGTEKTSAYRRRCF